MNFYFLVVYRSLYIRFDERLDVEIIQIDARERQMEQHHSLELLQSLHN